MKRTALVCGLIIVLISTLVVGCITSGEKIYVSTNLSELSFSDLWNKVVISSGVNNSSAHLHSFSLYIDTNHSIENLNLEYQGTDSSGKYHWYFAQVTSQGELQTYHDDTDIVEQSIHPSILLNELDQIDLNNMPVENHSFSLSAHCKAGIVLQSNDFTDLYLLDSGDLLPLKEIYFSSDIPWFTISIVNMPETGGDVPVSELWFLSQDLDKAISLEYLNNSEGSFGIYLIETGELIISDEHIESYNASSHEIHLNEQGIEQWNSYITTTPPTLAHSLFSKDFSLRINEEEIYQGTFWSWASSATCDGVTITESLFKLDEEYSTISIGYNCIDPRDNWLILYFFETEPEGSVFEIRLVETGELIISDEHIESYNASTHEIELNTEGIEQWNSFVTSRDTIDSKISDAWLHDKHFVVKIDGEEIYSGSFWPICLSTVNWGECSLVYFPTLNETFNTIWISYNSFDPRNDPRIIDFFESQGLMEH